MNILPKFKDCAKSGRIDQKDVVIYYSNGCPHTDKYILIAEKVLKDFCIPYELIKLESVKEAQSAPTPCTIYTLYIDGVFVTNEVLTEKRLIMYLEKYGKMSHSG